MLQRWLIAGCVCFASLPVFSEQFPPVADLSAHAELPDPLIMLDGTKVTTAAQWHDARRPQLKKLFEHYMYGSPPPAPPRQQMRFIVEQVDPAYLGGTATKKLITVRFGPEHTPPIHLLVILPNTSAPVAVFVGPNFPGNHALTDDPTIPISSNWVYPGYPGVTDNRASEASRGSHPQRWPIAQIIRRGYGIATFHNSDIDPDKPDFSDGVHAAYAKDKQISPDEHSWGTIAAWAWGVSRAVDYLVTDRRVDAQRIAVVGHSRLGKTALLAAAMDTRIALCIPHQSGTGGAAPSRSKNPNAEPVERINTHFPHWFNDTFQKFNTSVEKLPFDQHCLVAMVAPRPVLLTTAEDDQWANPPGQFEMLQAASPVYTLLGVEGLAADHMPPHNHLVTSRLGYLIRPGKHAMGPEDWQTFMNFADQHLKAN